MTYRTARAWTPAVVVLAAILVFWQESIALLQVLLLLSFSDQGSIFFL